jgi:hypothetical protein
MDPLYYKGLRERIQVGAGGDLGNPKTVAEVGYTGETLLLDNRDNALAADRRGQCRLSYHGFIVD